MTKSTGAVDLDWVSGHFSPIDQRLAGEGPLLGDGLWSAIDLMLEHCPVVRSDGRWFGCPEGGWVVSRYEDVRAIMQNPEVFSSRVKKGLGDHEPAQIPFDIDPPSLLEYRRFLQPHFTIHAVARFESVAREIIAQLIDSFVESGKCADFVDEVSYPFSMLVQWKSLVGVEEEHHERVMDWVLTVIHRRFEPEFERARQAWMNWIGELIDQRRSEPRRDDLIDGLLYDEMQGRLLSDDEITRIIMSVTLGGVTALADAISNPVLRLAVYPELQERLRGDLGVLPRAIEEFLRIEGSATGHPRRCTRDVVVGGEELKAGEQLFLHVAAANRDPAQFEDPNVLNIDRDRNPHLTFGVGHHRCLGSNFARMCLRVVLEEVLLRMHDIKLIDNDPPQRTAGIGWMVSHLPLSFTASPLQVPGSP